MMHGDEHKHDSMESPFLNVLPGSSYPTFGALPTAVSMDNGIGQSQACDPSLPGLIVRGGSNTEGDTCEPESRYVLPLDAPRTNAILTHDDGAASQQVIVVGLDDLRAELLYFAAILQRDIAEISAHEQKVHHDDACKVKKSCSVKSSPPPPLKEIRHASKEKVSRFSLRALTSAAVAAVVDEIDFSSSEKQRSSTPPLAKDEPSCESVSVESITPPRSPSPLDLEEVAAASSSFHMTPEQNRETEPESQPALLHLDLNKPYPTSDAEEMARQESGQSIEFLNKHARSISEPPDGPCAVGENARSTSEPPDSQLLARRGKNSQQINTFGKKRQLDTDPTSPHSDASGPSQTGTNTSGGKRLSIDTHRRGAAKQRTSFDLAIGNGEDGEAAVKTKSCKRRLLDVVSSPPFDYIVAAVILLNGIMVGVLTHHMAENMLETPPVPFQVLEISFCILFSTELGMRLCAYRLNFFTMSGVGWNMFDLVVVTLQIVELLMSAVTAGLGFSFTILRVLRLLRVIRLARALRLISELRTIVSSIAGSLKPLFWTGVLLFMVVYVVGVYTTQVVLNKRISLHGEGRPLPAELAFYWGSLTSSIFSLFMSISGGVDWDMVARPLIDHISPEMGLLFALYIMFTVLAMLNVVTGVFIEAVMKHAAVENEERTRNGLKRLFTVMDLNEGDSIEWPEFEIHLQRKEMKEFFRTIDVDIKNAKNLFELLDTDYSGSLDTDEILDGCLKIWAPCQSLDMQMMRRDLAALVQNLQEVGLIRGDAGDSPRRQRSPDSPRSPRTCADSPPDSPRALT